MLKICTHILRHDTGHVYTGSFDDRVGDCGLGFGFGFEVLLWGHLKMCEDRLMNGPNRKYRIRNLHNSTLAISILHARHNFRRVWGSDSRHVQ